MDHDVVIVGGGIVGLATAFQLLENRSKMRVLIVEKESRLAAHQTGNNSGVLHSGLYYKPGTEKAKLSVSGLQQMIAFCREHGIAYEQCGKIVVATDEAELPRLENLWQRGVANGLLGLRKLTGEQIKEIEPYATGLAAIHVPQEGIVDYPAVCEKLGELIRKAGGEIRLNTRLRKLISVSGRVDRRNLRRGILRPVCGHLWRASRRPPRPCFGAKAVGENHSVSRRVLSNQKGTAASRPQFDLSCARSEISISGRAFHPVDTRRGRSRAKCRARVCPRRLSLVNHQCPRPRRIPLLPGFVEISRDVSEPLRL